MEAHEDLKGKANREKYLACGGMGGPGGLLVP
jgi:hypothetical protein